MHVTARTRVQGRRVPAYPKCSFAEKALVNALELHLTIVDT